MGGFSHLFPFSFCCFSSQLSFDPEVQPCPAQGWHWGCSDNCKYMTCMKGHVLVPLDVPDVSVPLLSTEMDLLTAPASAGLAVNRYFGDPTAALIAALLTWQAAPTPSSLNTGKSSNSWPNSPWVQVFNHCTVAVSVPIAGWPWQQGTLQGHVPAQPGARRGWGQ